MDEDQGRTVFAVPLARRLRFILGEPVRGGNSDPLDGEPGGTPSEDDVSGRVQEIFGAVSGAV